MKQIAIARNILDRIQYATLATVCQDGSPWNTPVFCAHDELPTIYWSSHPEAVHSMNINRSAKAFIVIYNSKAGEDDTQGLYIRAEVHEVSDLPEIRHALRLLGKRRGRPFEHPEKFIANGPQRIYRATPIQMWINEADQDDDGDFIKDYRLEVPLPL